MGSEDEDSESDEDADVGRAEELRRERLTALVKRNLTTILLEVTDRMFGVLSSSHCHACILTHGEDAPALLHDQEV